MTSSLWFQDPNPEARRAGVAQARAWYRWDRDLLAPLPMLEIPNTGSKPGILEFL